MENPTGFDKLPPFPSAFPFTTTTEGETHLDASEPLVVVRQLDTQYVDPTIQPDPIDQANQGMLWIMPLSTAVNKICTNMVFPIEEEPAEYHNLTLLSADTNQGFEVGQQYYLEEMQPLVENNVESGSDEIISYQLSIPEVENAQYTVNGVQIPELDLGIVSLERYFGSNAQANYTQAKGYCEINTDSGLYLRETGFSSQLNKYPVLPQNSPQQHMAPTDHPLTSFSPESIHTSPPPPLIHGNLPPSIIPGIVAPRKARNAKRYPARNKIHKNTTYPNFNDPVVQRRYTRCKICKVEIIKSRMNYHLDKFHTVDDSTNPRKIKKCTMPHCSASIIIQKNYMRIWNQHYLYHQKKGQHSTHHLKQLKFSVIQDYPKIPKYPCTQPFCGKSLHTPEQLRVHATHHARFQCEYCQTVVYYAPEMAMHELEQHAGKNRIHRKGRVPGRVYKAKCARCPYVSATYPPYIRHYMKEHLGLQNINFLCTICKSTFAKKNSLTRHVKEFHTWSESNLQKYFKCKQCPAFFTSVDFLARHSKRKHEQSRTCKICHKVYSRYPEYKVHVETIHPQQNILLRRNRYICKKTNCNKSFATKVWYQRHKQFCIGKPDKENHMIKCELCDKTFSAQYKLKRHKGRVHHQGSYFCFSCGKAFNSQANLQLHSEFHNKPAFWKYECATCGKKFVSKHKLLGHEIIHEPMRKLHYCKWCDAKYTRKHGLRNHIISKHPEKMKEAGIGKKKMKGNYLKRKGTKKGECVYAGVKNQ